MHEKKREVQGLWRYTHSGLKLPIAYMQMKNKCRYLESSTVIFRKRGEVGRLRL
jgi:hypothetical protein